MYKSYLLLVLFTYLFTVNAQIPTYYEHIDFTQDSESVRDQLATLISDTHAYELTYTPEVWDALKVTDLDTEDGANQNVLLLYGYDNNDGDYQSDRTRHKELNCTFTTGCSGYWNREHVYVRSLGTPNLGFDNAGSDAHAIRACDAEMNSSRSNRLFAAGQGNVHITANGHWYPGDEWIGDVARMMMYMYLRYPTQAIANNIAISTNNNHTDMPDIFLHWNVVDPVSEYEIQRNNYLNAAQGNRNPFIDNPYLATIIWGGEAAENTWQLSTVDLSQIEFSIYPNPTVSNIYYETNQAIKAITIYSSNGKRVGKDKNLNDNKVNLPSSTGVYYLKIEGANQTYYEKVVKN